MRKILAFALFLFIALSCIHPANAFLFGGVPTSAGVVPSCSYPLPSGSNTVASAYGLRLLRAGYATPAKIVRVQRASDNAESDIGSINSCDLDTASFTTFCAATTCFASKWYDQSGNGVDITQSTFSNMPQMLLAQQNGHPALIFNGTSQILTGTLTSSISTDTWAAVAKNGSSLASGHYIGTIGTASQNTGLQTGVGNCLASQNGSGSFQGTITCNTSTWYRWIGTMTPTLTSVYINGTKGTDATNSITVTASTDLAIGGAVKGGPILYWTGSISEVMIFNPSISISDSNALSTNQGTYWAL